jgi:hypothetical protein
MFKKCIITKAPSGKFHLVGRVPGSLMHKAFDSVDDAKVACVDVMIEMGESFPVDVQAID